MTNAAFYAQKLMANHQLVDGQIVLELDGLRIGVRSNTSALLEKLGMYFSHVLGAGPADLEVLALQSAAMDLGVEFVDWHREPGKTGRKDTYVNLADGRLHRKARTGMIFLQSDQHRIAVGPCLENDNQVINFINALYMSHLQQDGALICHASGLTMNWQCLGMAGLSGGGKSTLMLHMLAHQGVRYLTNDRLFLKREADEVRAIGIPKLPRINPGTIVHNETLLPLLSEQRRKELLALPQQELWALEEKYDVDVQDIYGDDKFASNAVLAAFLILNWSLDSTEPCTIEQVDLSARRELLGAIMKSPGPFYQLKDGSFYGDENELVPSTYLEMLEGVPIFEARGAVDFEQAVRFGLDQLKD